MKKWRTITFGQASSTGTAMLLFMKQIGMYLTYETELYILEFRGKAVVTI